MSGSDMDELADWEQLQQAARDHFDEETEIQDEDADPTAMQIVAARKKIR